MDPAERDPARNLDGRRRPRHNHQRPRRRYFAGPKLWTPTDRARTDHSSTDLILARSRAGHGIGLALIGWACDHAARAGHAGSGSRSGLPASRSSATTSHTAPYTSASPPALSLRCAPPTDGRAMTPGLREFQTTTSATEALLPMAVKSGSDGRAVARFVGGISPCCRSLACCTSGGCRSCCRR